MGLDMYLEAEFHISGGYGYIREDAKKNKPYAIREVSQFDSIIGTLGLSSANLKLSEMNYLEVNVEVAYWRKANAIHSWFVRNVQDGKDECQRSYTSKEKLQELVDSCKKILSTVSMGEPETKIYDPPFMGSYITYPNLELDVELAARLLAPQGGFFFGSLEYNEWYVENLKDTISQIETILEDPILSKAMIYYQASW